MASSLRRLPLRNRLSDKPLWPEGVGRLIYGAIDSTNTEGLRLAASLNSAAWLLAEEQTVGRGRRARPWASPKGNFHGTLVMAACEAADQVALRSFAAALALRDAFIALTGLAGSFTLKWPNDVLLNGGKVAGILLESVAAGHGVSHLVIGVGVNLIAAPDAGLLEPGALRAVTLLEETGLRVGPEQFLDQLAPSYAVWEAIFVSEGFAPLRAAWLANAARLGEVIRARTGTQSREGRFETVDASGALILGTAQGRVAIPAAEVFFDGRTGGFPPPDPCGIFAPK